MTAKIFDSVLSLHAVIILCCLMAVGIRWDGWRQCHKPTLERAFLRGIDNISTEAREGGISCPLFFSTALIICTRFIRVTFKEQSWTYS